MKVTWIGHATALVEIGSARFLTDPNFSDPILFLWRRQIGLKFDPTQLPSLTAVCLSHLHFDHFDISSYKYLPVSTPIVMPHGLARHVSRFLPNPTIELQLWSEHRFPDGTRIHLLPAHHRSGRISHLRLRATGSFLIEGVEGTVYFAGDTGPMPEFADIATVVPIDVALLPLDPPGILENFRALKARHLIPIHWGGFPTGFRDARMTLTDLKNRVAEGEEASRVHIMEPGGSLEF